jgi:Kdo2-lipid IVA lauroyltransferase/acyltransferase
MRKKTKSRIEFMSFLIFYNILKLFPYKMIKSMLINLFILVGLKIGVRKKVAEQNLHMVYPEKSRKDIYSIMHGMYRQLAITATETYFADIKDLYDDFEVDGMEYLEEALSLDKGVIVASGHFGNWELAGRYIARTNKLSVIYKKLRNRYFDEFNNKIRNDENCVLIEKKQALRKILALLKKKYIVTIMVDQNARKNGVVIDFMGFPASTFVGTAKIAIKTGTPIVPGIALRRKNDKNYLVFEPMIDVTKYSNSESSIKELTQYVSKRVEKYVVENPDQWFWVHRRWRGARKEKNV